METELSKFFKKAYISQKGLKTFRNYKNPYISQKPSEFFVSHKNLQNSQKPSKLTIPRTLVHHCKADSADAPHFMKRTSLPST